MEDLYAGHTVEVWILRQSDEYLDGESEPLRGALQGGCNNGTMAR
jgi:hypothetical protein